MVPGEKAPRRFLVPVRGVLSIEAPDGDTAYRVAEQWLLTTGKRADEDVEGETTAPRVQWLRTEPESDEFPGWYKPKP